MAAWRNPQCLRVWMVFLHTAFLQTTAEKSPGAYFLPEFALSPQGSFLEDTTGEEFLTYRYDDQTSRNAHSEEDTDGSWDAWGDWSDCSRTCGGGASYSLRRCLTGRNCEGQNIRYKTCSNQDCPADAEDFRAQQCSAYNDVQYQGHYHEWLPRYHDPTAPCALKCQARGRSLVVELAPKVLDGTRCNTDSLDMCISGTCQVVGCDHQLGSRAKEDSCGVCAGDGSTCRLVRGQSHVSPEKREENVIAVPLGSRSVRITVKGPAHLFIESKTLHGSRGEYSFPRAGTFMVENSTVEFQRGPERQTFRVPGPLNADFIFKARHVAARDSVVQFFFYQPISHQWRQTDFFPCTATCGGGYQLNSAECVDMRLGRVVPDHYCHYYPENVKPKPKLRECSMEPCPSSDGFKEIRPYDHFQPLPRWEHNPWTACSVSCGGGIQRRSFVCVEESVQGTVLQVEEWKCMYAPRPHVLQTCNLFHCPRWAAMDWSQCTVTCGRGLRYRVVLCLDHRGEHVGGCNPQLKLHIKEECVVPVPCHKPREKGPVEASLPWLKQAHELEERGRVSEEPTLIAEPWSPCSTTCGPGIQLREVRCLVFLTFTQTETELPANECQGPTLPTQRSCLLRACAQSPIAHQPPSPLIPDGQTAYDWEYAGFTPCTATCWGGPVLVLALPTVHSSQSLGCSPHPPPGHQEAIAVCLHVQTQRVVNESLCDRTHRPPAMSQTCNTKPCPPRWQTGPWGPCSASCGVGIQTREVQCLHPGESSAPLQDCPEEKPHGLQACSQFPCPPTWHVEDWQQCSRTCGGGTQWRRVTCRQLLTDGSFRSLSDELCPVPKASSHKSCARIDCPPQLTTGHWSQCSVSCGRGTQRRKQVCHRLTAGGRRVPASKQMCEPNAELPLVRTCWMPACPAVQAELGGQRPEILGVRRVYIQTRAQLRVTLTVGSRAYLWPNTSVVIRCPVRHFQRLQVRWEKDGHCLHSSPRLAITKSGALKLRRLAAPDIGTYHCIAGSARDSVLLKLIGTDNRLLLPPAVREQSGVSPTLESLDHQADPLGATRHKMRASQKVLQSVKGQAAQQPSWDALLGPCGGTGSFWELQQLEGAAQLGAYSMDVGQFEELIRNMSQLVGTGEAGDDLASQLIYQLVASLAAVPQQREVPPYPDMEGTGKPTLQPQGPTLVRSNQAPSVSLNQTVNIRIGDTAYVTPRTTVVNILCELLTPMEATFMWTKNGAPVQPSDRIIWDGMGKMQIRNPTKKEEGLYGCLVSSHLGSDTERSLVLFAEAPAILSVERVVTVPKHSHLSVVVGGVIEAALGANVMIHCPTDGVPAPHVTWAKAGGGHLSDGDSSLLSASLRLYSVGLRDEGTYVCTATNALGEATAHTELRLQEQTQPSSHFSFRKNHRKPEVHDADPTSEAPPPELSWKLGHWTPCSASCGPLGTRVQKAQCVTATGQHVVEALCAHLKKPRASWQPCHPRDCPPRWVTGAWSSCSVSCGKGFRHRQVMCYRTRASGGVQLLAPPACAPRDRPLGKRACTQPPCDQWDIKLGSQCPERCLGHAGSSQPLWGLCPHHNDSSCEDSRGHPGRSCSPRDCMGCWLLHPWGSCSAPCGGGFQVRRVRCLHPHTCLPLAEGRCVQRHKPAARRPCLGPPCERD
ncbi:ADAMTS-like protein 3 isoform X3 [Sorex araneus]|uniref:ADAMTS-like protein 3 isoform X3 n=1 Tax=Sorex araneus TaxID=42254 RepID=UPI002433755C|nr:ADAMTS-like protein 3 isoform X3 [Sorex araneus]